jgi:hypothetical protein
MSLSVRRHFDVTVTHYSIFVTDDTRRMATNPRWA